jgi:hypothetical protein
MHEKNKATADASNALVVTHTETQYKVLSGNQHLFPLPIHQRLVGYITHTKNTNEKLALVEVNNRINWKVMSLVPNWLEG